MSNVPFYAEKSFFVESGTYQAPVLRTYETNYNEVVTQQYLNETANGTRIVPNAFANISANILQPSAAPTANINIDNGWNERRMSFIIDIVVPDNFGGANNVVLTGYTDMCDVSPTKQHFDPNMRLYINASMIVTTITQRQGDHTRKVKAVLDSSHLLNRSILHNLMPTQDVYGTGGIHYATPRNVIYEMHNISSIGAGNFLGGITDTRIQGNEMTVNRSRRDNTLPTTYLSKILRGVNDNMSGMTQGIAEDENDALINAAASVSEADINIDRVMMAIQMYDSGFFLQHGYITWSQLCNIIPNLDAATRFSTRQSRVVESNAPDAYSGNFNHWHGVGAETVIANNVAQFIPAIMTNCLIGTISFAFSNDNINLQPTIVITDGQTVIDGLHLSQVASKFETRFLSEVAPMITDQGRSTVNLVVRCSLGTETFITVSKNGGPDTPYCAPSFCDSLYTPIIAPNQAMLTGIASDLQNIANSVNSTLWSNTGFQY